MLKYEESKSIVCLIEKPGSVSRILQRLCSGCVTRGKVSVYLLLTNIFQKNISGFGSYYQHPGKYYSNLKIHQRIFLSQLTVKRTLICTDKM